MQFTTTVVSTFAFMLASQAAGASVESRNSLIATNAVAACNCPHNCNYGINHSCEYYTTSSSTGPTADGTCQEENGTLTCIPTTS